MSRQMDLAINGMLGVIIVLILTAMLPRTTPAQTEAFRSPDGRYEARLFRSETGVHYQIKEVRTGRTALTTNAQYPEPPNKVKTGAFSRDSKKFAAAYHYGHEGRYTWIGIWNIETGSPINEERIDGWKTENVYSVVNKEYK